MATKAERQQAYRRRKQAGQSRDMAELAARKWAPIREEYVFLTRVLGYASHDAARHLGVNTDTADNWERKAARNPERWRWHAEPTEEEAGMLARLRC